MSGMAVLLGTCSSWKQPDSVRAAAVSAKLLDSCFVFTIVWVMSDCLFARQLLASR